MEQKYLITQINKKTGHLETFDIRTGEVISRNGEMVQAHKFAYSLEIEDAICNLLREGYSLAKISRMEQFPQLSVIYKWQELHPKFKERIKLAKAGRAEYFRDKAEEVLDNTMEKEDVPVSKLKFEGYMKLAEKDNPAEYGRSQQQVGQQGPMQIVIHTGISRDEPTTVEVINEREDGTDIGREKQQLEKSSTVVVERGEEAGTGRVSTGIARAKEKSSQEKESF